jgi:transposase-like protein
MRERNNTKEIKKFFSSILRKEEEEEDVIIVDVSIVVSTLYPLPSTLERRPSNQLLWHHQFFSRFELH